MNRIIDPEGNGLLLDKEAALKQMFPCPECNEDYLAADESLTLFYRKKRNADFLNELRVQDTKEVFAFRCTQCGYKIESERLDLEYFRIVRKSENLYDVALNCNPYTGQTWSANSGFPTEKCPINGNQCYSELWKVCPHIGNADIQEYMKASVPLIGESK